MKWFNAFWRANLSWFIAVGITTYQDPHNILLNMVGTFVLLQAWANTKEMYKRLYGDK